MQMVSETISPVQLLANQLNALKSTGPRTDAGKSNVRYNARRHGLTGQFYCLSEGDEQAYLAYEANLLAELKPVGHYESQIAICIVQDRWRVNRNKATEFNVYGQTSNQFDNYPEPPSPNIQAAVLAAQVSQQNDRYFANIALYETRLHRIIAKNEKQLRELQAERRAAEAEALREAELLTRLALMKGEKPAETITVPSDTHPNGFVFSADRILAIISRKDRLAEAEFFEKRRWNRSAAYPGKPVSIPRAA
jgi:hypothetical protein